MVATRAIGAGEDLLLCYGKLDNSMLLLDYGDQYSAACEHVWQQVLLNTAVQGRQCMLSMCCADSADIQGKPTKAQTTWFAGPLQL